MGHTGSGQTGPRPQGSGHWKTPQRTLRTLALAHLPGCILWPMARNVPRGEDYTHDEATRKNNPEAWTVDYAPEGQGRTPVY